MMKNPAINFYFTFTFSFTNEKNRNTHPLNEFWSFLNKIKNEEYLSQILLLRIRIKWMDGGFGEPDNVKRLIYLCHHPFIHPPSPKGEKGLNVHSSRKTETFHENDCQIM